MKYTLRFFQKPVFRTLTALVLMLSAQQVFAQQDPMYTQYMFNSLVLNPAYAGSRESIAATALYRNQWVNIKGAPITKTFSVHAPVKKERIGLGITFVNDEIGVTKTNFISGSYAYRIRLKNAGTIAMGLNAGVKQLYGDFTSINHSYNPGTADPTFTQVVNQWVPNFGAGLYYSTKRFYLGFSVPNIINSRFRTEDDPNPGGQVIRQYQHFFVTSGYVFDVGAGLKLKPSVLLKYVSGAPVEMDLNANLWFYDRIAFGLSYRTADSFSALVEFQVTPQFGVGYAYDQAHTELRKYNAGSHELMVRYDFNFSGKVNKIITPRYF